MGLFDSIVSQAAGSLLSGGNTNAPAGMMNVVMGLLNDNGGGAAGLQGLVSQFASKGLGDVVQSWIGTGANLPISAEQIQAVLGSQQVQGIAQQLGLSPDAASNVLAQFLPQAVDTVTPGGQLDTNQLLSQGLSMLKGFTNLAGQQLAAGRVTLASPRCHAVTGARPAVRASARGRPPDPWRARCRPWSGCDAGTRAGAGRRPRPRSRTHRPDGRAACSRRP